MIGRTLLLIGSAALLAAPSAASAGGERTSICHRTGAPARTPGLFQGQIIEVSDSALSKHVSEHGDVVIPGTLRSRFSGRSCQTDGAGGLFDGSGRPVEPAPTGPTGPTTPIDEGTPR